MSDGRAHDLAGAVHAHSFGDAGARERERAMGAVALLTLATMVLELGAGWWSASLALTADGWHMGTHAAALGGAWAAYRLSARAGSRYAFGGWKIEVLSAYTSGLGLLAVAAWILYDAWKRILNPEPVAYQAALAVAVLGLAVNLASALMLLGAAPRDESPADARAAHADDGHHGQAHPGGQHVHQQGRRHPGHPHPAHHGHRKGHAHDANFSAAYLHVVADALTSVLAIVALAGGAWLGWTWLDTAVAVVGAVVIGRWAFGVLGSTARVLVDASTEPALVARIRRAIESDDDATVADLHVWQVGGEAWAAALAVVADTPRSAAEYRARLESVEPLRHLTIEVHPCPGCAAAPGDNR